MGMSGYTSAQLFLHYGVHFVLSLQEYRRSYTTAWKRTTLSMEPLPIFPFRE
jgi:hypothetical protein